MLEECQRQTHLSNTDFFPPALCSLLSALCSPPPALCSLLSALYSLPLSPLPSTLYPLNFSSLSPHCSRISNTRFSSEAGSMVVFWLFGGCGRVARPRVVFGVNRVFNQCVHSKHVWRLGTSIAAACPNVAVGVARISGGGVVQG